MAMRAPARPAAHAAGARRPSHDGGLRGLSLEHGLTNAAHRPTSLRRGGGDVSMVAAVCTDTRAIGHGAMRVGARAPRLLAGAALQLEDGQPAAFGYGFHVY